MNEKLYSFCPNCGAELLPKGAKYCSQCGESTDRTMEEIRQQVAKINHLAREKARREENFKNEQDFSDRVMNLNKSEQEKSVIAFNKRKWYLILPYIFFVLTYICYYLYQNILKASLPQNNLSTEQWLFVGILLVPAAIYSMMYIFSLPSSLSIVYSIIMPFVKILIYIPIIGWLIWIGIFFSASIFLNNFAAPALFGDFLWSKKYKQMSIGKATKLARQEAKREIHIKI